MKNLLLFLLLFTGIISSQNKNLEAEDLNITPLVEGTLLVPKINEKIPLAIIIGGSGPTDRNGNQQMLENNSLMFLAEGLYEKNIATFRYDKRIVKQMKQGTVEEKDIRFDDFINDAVAVIKHFENDERFSKIFIIGHSQGSLVGMLAAQNEANGFISIAGAGQSIDQVIIDQLASQAPGLVENARTAFKELRENGTTSSYDPGLASIFRKDIQAFIFSWMQYDPKEEIAKLNIPVLIINGDNDIQVQVSEAEKLHQSKPDAEFKIIHNMNHIFKVIDGDILENTKSYNIDDLPVMPELIETIDTFITKKI